MKKFFTLMILSAFVAVSAFADDSSLGDIKWSIKDGAKINPAKTITLTFPNATGFEFGSTVEIACNLYAADEAPSVDNAFDGIEGTITDGVAFILPDFEVQESTSYILKVTSILVNGVEVIGDTVYTLNFKTRGAERQLSWTFTIDGESVKKIHKDDGNGNLGTYVDDNGKTQNNPGDYWCLIAKDTRHYVHKKLNYEEIMLDANTVLPMTEGLLFSIGADKVYVGDTAKTDYQKNLVFNGTKQKMIVPDCKIGDIITINCFYSSKNKGAIYVPNAMAKCLNDGALVSNSQGGDGDADSIRTGSKDAPYKFEVKIDGDVEFIFDNNRVTSLVIDEAKPIVDVNYSVVAVAADDETKILKTYVEPTLGKTNDVAKVSYSYWLRDESGNIYTYGTKGEPFTATYYLGSNDTVFALKYKKIESDDVAVYLSEAEDWFDEENLESPIQLCTNENSAIRSSNGKAAYCAAEEGYQLTTLPAGKYKIRTVLFDANKTASYMPTFMVGSEEVTLSAISTNFAEVESGVIEITEESPVILKQSGNDKQGIDIIAIYATDELPEPDFQLGDANGDGEITMADANMVVNYFLAEDKDSIDNFHFEAADANEDGDITMADANKIVNIFLGTDSVVE